MPRLTNRRAARLNYAKGRTFFENRQLEEARNWFARALALSPDYLPALQGMAEVLVRTNMVNDAAAFLARALVVPDVRAEELGQGATLPGPAHGSD